MIEQEPTGRGAAAAEDLALTDAPLPVSPRRLEELQAEARYHRERYDLYKAKTYGSRITSAARLRELERRHLGADSRLRSAQRQSAQATAAKETQG